MLLIPRLIDPGSLIGIGGVSWVFYRKLDDLTREVAALKALVHLLMRGHSLK